jgi:hypothetical protein
MGDPMCCQVAGIAPTEPCYTANCHLTNNPPPSCGPYLVVQQVLLRCSSRKVTTVFRLLTRSISSPQPGMSCKRVLEVCKITHNKHVLRRQLSARPYVKRLMHVVPVCLSAAQLLCKSCSHTDPACPQLHGGDQSPNVHPKTP